MDPRFTTNELRHMHIDELQAELEVALETKSASEWLNLLDAAGVPCGPINTVRELVADEQIAARKMIVETVDKVAGPLKIAGNPIKVSGVPDPVSVPAPPQLDEHRTEILTMLKTIRDAKR